LTSKTKNLSGGQLQQVELFSLFLLFSNEIEEEEKLLSE